MVVEVSSASQSTMSAIWPSDMTAAPDRAEFSATSGGSGRVTSSRWPNRVVTVTASEPALPRTTTAYSASGAAEPPKRSAASTSCSRDLD